MIDVNELKTAEAELAKKSESTTEPTEPIEKKDTTTSTSEPPEEPQKKEPENNQNTGTENPEEPWFKKYGFETEEQAAEIINKKKELKTTIADEFDRFISSTGIEDFDTFKFVRNFNVPEKPSMDDMLDTIVAKMIIDDPDNKGSEKILKSRLEKQLGIQRDIDPDFASEEELYEQKLAQKELKKRFDETTKFFTETKEKLAKSSNEQQQSVQKEDIDGWQNFIENSTKELKIDIYKKKEDGSLGDLDRSFKFDEEMTKDYKTVLSEYGKAIGYKANGDATETAKNIAFSYAVAKNIDKIIREAMSQARAETIKEFHIENDNPSAVRSHEKKKDTTEFIDNSGSIFKR